MNHNLSRWTDKHFISDRAIVNAYVAKTGLSKEEILNMMKNETFMSASEAVEKGFAIARSLDFSALEALSKSSLLPDT